MNKPPIKQPTQDDYIKTSLRIPRELHSKLLGAAEYHGRTLNAEILDRLQAGPLFDLLHALARDNAEMKAMIKEMHDLSSGK